MAVVPVRKEIIVASGGCTADALDQAKGRSWIGTIPDKGQKTLKTMK